MRYRSIELDEGTIFGRLKTLKPTTVNNRPGYVCLCECGNETSVRTSKLISGHTKSCGCYNIDMIVARNITGVTPVEVLYRQYKYGAAARKHIFQLSFELFAQLVTKSCHYCGVLHSRTTSTEAGILQHNGIDRVDNDRNYVEGNVVTACKRCNIAKGKLSYQEFIDMARAISNHMGA